MKISFAQPTVTDFCAKFSDIVSKEWNHWISITLGLQVNNREVHSLLLLKVKIVLLILIKNTYRLFTIYTCFKLESWGRRRVEVEEELRSYLQSVIMDQLCSKSICLKRNRPHLRWKAPPVPHPEIRTLLSPYVRFSGSFRITVIRVRSVE